MQQTAQIVSKLRNARFQPANGAAKEKLAWINGVEADLLRSIGGSGKRKKFGVPSFSYADSHPSAGFGSRSTGVDHSDSSGASNARNSGTGGVGSRVSQNRDGSLSVNGGAAPQLGKVQVTPLGITRQMLPPTMPPLPMPTPVSLPPAAIPPAAITPMPRRVSGPLTRVDLNPATLAPWGQPMAPTNPSTFPARPGVAPRRGVANKDQSRLGTGGRSTGRGFSGGGYGGGSGGGW